MTPIEIVLEHLHGAKRGKGGWTARCPAHDDRRPSLSVSAVEDGRVLVKCHAGCSTEAIVEAIGLTMRDLMPERSGPTPIRNGSSPKPSSPTYSTAEAALAELSRRHGKPVAVWTYHDADGNSAGHVVRWSLPDGRKDIRPASRHEDGWRIAAMPEPRPLYRLPTLASASRVLIAEGEKCADAAFSIGFTATTSVSGSQAAAKTDWSPLAGKEVWVLPDNDAPGRKYAATVAGILATLTPPASVRIIELPELPVGGDIVDWIGAHGDAAGPDELRKHLEQLADAVELESSSAPIADNEHFQSFPLRTLPEPIRGFVMVGSRAIGCDPSYLALPLLTSLASAIGTSRRLELKRGWTVPAILWGAIVGESGTAKTPAFRLVMRPIRDRQSKALERHAEAAKKHETELAAYEKEYAGFKRSKDPAAVPPAKPEPPQAERYIVSDTTVEAIAPILMNNPRGLMLARDELAGWIGSFDRYAGRGKAGADAANWLSMFSAESIIVDRKTGTPRTIHVPQAAVCVVGGVQPEILRRALGSEHRESGLAARLLLCYPPRRAKQWTEADIDPGVEFELSRLFDRLFELHPMTNEFGEDRPVLIRCTADAKSVFTAYYNAHAQEQADLAGELSAAWSKLEEYAARLALVIHYVRWAVGSVKDDSRMDVESMSAGIILANWFKGEARRVYAMLNETEADGDLRRLAEWIERRGGSATTREVQQGCRWLRGPGAAEESLEHLAKSGSGRWQDAAASSKGGRPTRVFELSTTSTSTKPRDASEFGGFVDVDAVDTPLAAHEGEDASFRDGRLFTPLQGLPD